MSDTLVLISGNQLKSSHAVLMSLLLAKYPTSLVLLCTLIYLYAQGDTMGWIRVSRGRTDNVKTANCTKSVIDMRFEPRLCNANNINKKQICWTIPTQRKRTNIEAQFKLIIYPHTINTFHYLIFMTSSGVMTIKGFITSFSIYSIRPSQRHHTQDTTPNQLRVCAPPESW
uniref:Uncharacterized protein n=1 Tax=Glossina brevipalpis TaxID=37001 RepID=A0A1A9WLG6_9MUSC